MGLFAMRALGSEDFAQIAAELVPAELGREQWIVSTDNPGRGAPDQLVIEGAELRALLRSAGLLG
jgi:hypothetical protein